VFDLIEAFYAQRLDGDGPPPTRIRLRMEVLAGTWEAVLHGQADLALGVSNLYSSPHIRLEPLGENEFVFCIAPHHPLAAMEGPLAPNDIAPHRIVAVADTARQVEALTVGIVPGQDVLTLPSLAAKLEAIVRGLGCGRLPLHMVRRHLEAGRLVMRETDLSRSRNPIHYAWRDTGSAPGKALAWWLAQLASPITRRALLEQHEGLLL
jgi:DNA-binding transcriptional LysR family regulator